MTRTVDASAGDDGAGHAPAASPDPALPAGFVPMRMPTNPFIDGIGPLYGRLDEGRFVLGIRIERRHCNPGGTCHGGMIMTLSDMLLLMGSNIEGGVNRYFTTVNVTCDFIAPAPEGAWVEGCRCCGWRAAWCSRRACSPPATPWWPAAAAS